ncbi:MAG: hypothetical protein JJE40_09975 [Vicinamibacteria bacterium]|nr:hypothetical protein [Vicinamibacteria bacterium]
MTWIKIVRPEEADPSLLDLLQKTRAMYPPEYEVPVASIGEGESIVLSHTLIPEAMHHAFALLAVLMRPELPLERRHHEMLATVVSSANRCFF